MPRNYGERTPVYVTMGIATSGATALFRYAFLSALRDSQRNDFGQTEINSSLSSIEGLIFKANNIKPAKASILRGGNLGYESSFCSSSVISTLKGNGAQITKAKFRYPALSGAANSTLYYATINGVKIGYRIPYSSNLPSDLLSVTGLKIAGEDDVVIMGASFPKLGTLKFVDSQTGQVRSYGADPTNYNSTLPDGWSKGKPPLNTKQHFIELLGLA